MSGYQRLGLSAGDHTIRVRSNSTEIQGLVTLSNIIHFSVPMDAINITNIVGKSVCLYCFATVNNFPQLPSPLMQVPLHFNTVLVKIFLLSVL